MEYVDIKQLANQFRYDFSGKKIILFATSGGSKFGKTVEELKVSVPASCEIIEGKLLNGKQTIPRLLCLLSDDQAQKWQQSRQNYIDSSSGYHIRLVCVYDCHVRRCTVR